MPGDGIQDAVGRLFIEAYLLAVRNTSGSFEEEFLRESLESVADAMERKGLVTDPRTIGVDAMVEFFKGCLGDPDRLFWEGYDGALEDLCAFRDYLEFYGNSAASVAMRRLLLCEDPSWLSELQVEEVLGTAMTPLQRLLVLLQLRMGLSFDEVCRLSTLDVSDEDGIPCLNIVFQGFILRTVPLAEEVKLALDEWMPERTKTVEASLAAFPGWKDPGCLVLGEGEGFDGRSGHVDESVRGLCQEAMDELSEYLLVDLSHGSLRTTCARAMLLAGTDPAAASQYLGMDVRKWVEETFPLHKDIDVRSLSGMVRFPEMPVERATPHVGPAIRHPQENEGDRGCRAGDGADVEEAGA